MTQYIIQLAETNGEGGADLNAVTFKDRALTCIKHGLPVVWVKSGEKGTALSNWQNLATTDLAQIDIWNAEEPARNVGCVAKAKLGGFWFLDLDKQGTKDHIEAETGKKIPTTWASRSQEGRGHLAFRQSPASISMGNITEASVRDGAFSCRVNDEYIVGPLSYRRDLDRSYELICDVEPIEAPDWLIEWCISQKVEKRQATVVRDESNLIPHGMIHPALVREAGSLRGRGYSVEATEDALLAWAHENCAPPLDEDHIQKVARSTKDWKTGDPLSEMVLVDGKLAGDTTTPKISQASEVLPLFSVDGDSFMREDIQPRKPLIQLIDKKYPIFFEQSINQIFAWRGLGKTCLGLGLTAALAKGGSFLNWEAPERSRVLYIEGELPQSQAQERWRQIIGETNSYARLVTIDKQPDNTIPSLASAVGMARVEKTLSDLETRGWKVDVLILDSISTLFNIEANNEEGWLVIQAWLIKLRSRGLCIFFFHHAGKTGLSRSHSKSEDMLDISIKLDKPKEPDTDCLHVLMHYDKTRAGFSEPDCEVRMHRAHSGNCLCRTKLSLIGCLGDSVRWEREVPRDGKKFEAEQLFAGGKSNQDIAEELDIKSGTVRKWRQRWKDKAAKLTKV